MLKEGEEVKVEEFFNEDPCQTQEQLTSVLGVTRQVIASTGNDSNLGTRVSYDLKSRDDERNFFAWE